MRIASRSGRRIGYWLTLLLAVVLCAACSGRRQQATGFAYTGPATLNIRGDLELRAPTTATVRHGDRLEILETRRRFVKVRTSTGAEGWTDTAYLLTQAQMDDLNRLAQSAARLPSLGAASVFDTLNVHTAASRSAPSFVQLEEGDPIEVIGHRVTPRGSSTTTLKTVPSAVPKHSSEQVKDAAEAVPAPPPAPAPPPPQGWTNLSRPSLEELKGAPPPRSSTDDWFLVRTPDGRAGWVLTRMVLMNIPDEVAQYAEGHYIMSYHSLGEVPDDRGGTKSHWLWTTSSLQDNGADFDSFRVFVFSQRRHRYETAYIERNVRGHYPVESVDLPDTPDPGFSLIVEDKDGHWLKRTYAFNGTRARVVSKVPYQPPPGLPEVRTAETFDQVTPDADNAGWTRKLGDLRRRWLGW